MLDEAFKKDGRKPILIATKGIVDAAVANEMAVMKKSKEIQNGDLFCLKDMITAEEWKKIQAMAKKPVQASQPKAEVAASTPEVPKIIDGVKICNLKDWLKEDNDMVVAKMVRFLNKCDGKISFNAFKEGIKYSGTQFESVVCNGKSDKAKYGKLWDCKKGLVEMNPNIRDIINNM
jgi:hypothetical protein